MARRTRVRCGFVLALAACEAGGGGASARESTSDDGSTGDTSTGDTTTGTPPTTSDGSTATTSSTSTSSSSSATDDESSTTGEPGPDDCERFDALVAALEADPDPTLVDAFVNETLYSEHGFPLRCDDGSVGFVATDLVGDGSLSIAGDFNDWDPAAHTLTPVVDGVALQAAFFDDAGAPGLYKLVLDGTQFVADPLARRFGWDEFGEYSLTAARDDASHHERWPAFAEAVGDLEPRTLVVYVPAGAFDRDDLPVLYMHDGQNLFAPDAFFGGWRVSITADELIADGSVPPFIVVGIPNTAARFDEYTHVPDDLGDGPVGGRADEYAAFIVDGIKPFVDARYPTDSSRAGTGVAGSSLGGLVSIFIAQRYPDVFGHAASMSGTFEWGTFGLANETIADLVAREPPDDVAIYLDSGGGGPCPGGNDNYCSTVELAELLRDLGWIDEQDLYYRFDSGAEHNEAAWAARLPAMLSDWFPAD